MQVGPSQFGRVLEMVKRVRGLGMEVCTTLGMLTPEQAAQARSLAPLTNTCGEGGWWGGEQMYGETGSATLTLGPPENPCQLRAAGLSAYNHNLDTSPEYYAKARLAVSWTCTPLTAAPRFPRPSVPARIGLSAALSSFLAASPANRKRAGR